MYQHYVPFMDYGLCTNVHRVKSHKEIYLTEAMFTIMHMWT